MANLSLSDITAELQTAISSLPAAGALKGRGVVSRLGDGVVTIHGLSEARLGEVLELKQGSETARALVLNLLEDEIGAVLLDENNAIGAGAEATQTGLLLSVPVGKELLGRVVDPLGRPLDGGPAIKTKTTNPIEAPAPDVMSRKSVHEPVATGILAIDSMVPVGRGQRQLIIGDRQTGKTAIALDAMLNQMKQGSGIISIYVAVGQKRSTIAQLVERLRAAGALEQSIIVATSATDPVTLQYLAPYAGAAIGEDIRDNGGHALVIYDDLTRHAQAYRQMSLLLRRPPGREAFPGDVFYLHSRLLERAAKLNDELGGGSLTALPVIETQAGNISAYIPTNVISITDGQIFLTSDLFNQGVRPAIDVGNSVSRVGGSAQPKAIKKLAGTLRVSLAQYAEVAAFTQFASDLDEATRAQLERGQRLTELLKQPLLSPLSVADMSILLLAGTTGPLDAVALDKIGAARADLLKALAKDKKLAGDINKSGVISDDQTKALNKLIDTTLDSYKEGQVVAQLQELTRRVRSISNTRQTTKAMQMVDGTKLRRAQIQAAKSKAYVAATTDVLKRILNSGTDLRELGLWQRETVGTVLIVVIASDRGLAGGYNANVANRLKKQVAEHAKNNLKIEIIAIGTNAIRAAGKLENATVIQSSTGVPTDPTMSMILPLATQIRQRYESQQADQIEVIYTHSVSTLQQEVRVNQVWPQAISEPVSKNETLLQKSIQAMMTLEPSPEEVASAALARVFDASILHAIQEAGVSEHAMRVNAMRNATDNATDLIDDLTLTINTIRQAGITQEISEITGAAAAIEG